MYEAADDRIKIVECANFLSLGLHRHTKRVETIDRQRIRSMPGNRCSNIIPIMSCEEYGLVKD